MVSGFQLCACFGVVRVFVFSATGRGLATLNAVHPQSRGFGFRFVGKKKVPAFKKTKKKKSKTKTPQKNEEKRKKKFNEKSEPKWTAACIHHLLLSVLSTIFVFVVGVKSHQVFLKLKLSLHLPSTHQIRRSHQVFCIIVIKCCADKRASLTIGLRLENPESRWHGEVQNQILQNLTQPLCKENKRRPHCITHGTPCRTSFLKVVEFMHCQRLFRNPILVRQTLLHDESIASVAKFLFSSS